MSEMEEKLGAILGNPQMMQKIMALAQSIETGAPQAEEIPKPVKKTESPKNPSLLDIDPRLIQSLTDIIKKSGMDQNQTTLLHALSPYLSRNRIGKLERAMQAARMAGAASIFLNSGGLQLLRGR